MTPEDTMRLKALLQDAMPSSNLSVVLIGAMAEAASIEEGLNREWRHAART